MATRQWAYCLPDAEPDGLICLVLLTGIPLRARSQMTICSSMDMTPGEVSQKEKDKYHMTSLIHGIETTTQMNLFTKQKLTHRQSTDLWLPRWMGGGGVMDGESGISRCKLLPGWPQRSCRFLHKILRKNPNELCGQPNIYRIYIQKTKPYCIAWGTIVNIL